MFRRNVPKAVGTLFHQLKVPQIANEPMNNFEPGSESRKKIEEALAKLKSSPPCDVPCIVAGKEYRPGEKITREIPSDIAQPLCYYHNADRKLIEEAVESALDARKWWSRTSLEQRLAIVFKAAHLISTTYRYEFQAATMLGQSKNAWQAEIDSVAETIDFFRFNAKYAEELYSQQPLSPLKCNYWDMLDYRPLEGFILSITPFNFTAIGANLAVAPAMMGNTVLWKPSPSSIYANYLTLKILEEAGMPPGVINFVPALPEDITAAATMNPWLAAVAFTGSTQAFSQISMQVSANLPAYRSYPRVSGETGGKNFHLVHPTAHLESSVACTLRSAFEYQGQKCSACSRTFVPKSLWPQFKDSMLEKHAKIKVGAPEDLTSFVCAVIDETAYNKITGYIDIARKDSACTILAGGDASKEKGYFVQPTIIETTDPICTTMVEEIFGPVLTVYVYDDSNPNWEKEVFALIDNSKYALTGGIFAKDREFLARASTELRDAAGNLYLNDKSTGAVVGMQPFGGARGSGTTDKAGAAQFMSRWVAPRTIKDTFEDQTDVSYPHQLPDRY